MIEIVVKNFLEGKMSVPVYMEEPEKKPSKYIILEKVGGGKSNGLKSASLAFQSYGSSLYDAAMLNEELKETMEDIDNQEPISRAELDSDYNFTDTETNRYRYQAVYDFIYY